MTSKLPYKLNELVQVIDPTTGIWTDAKILGVESDTQIRVDFVGWPKSQSKVVVDYEGCNFRRPERKQSVVQNSRRRNPIRLDYKPEMRVKLDLVYFVGRVRTDPTDVISGDEMLEEIAAAKTLRKGWVCTNDPFKHRMQVWTGEDEDGNPKQDYPEYVEYLQLRQDTWVHPAVSMTMADDEPEHDETAKEPRRKVFRHIFLTY